jgi:hypothetical protein
MIFLMRFGAGGRFPHLPCGVLPVVLQHDVEEKTLAGTEDRGCCVSVTFSHCSRCFVGYKFVWSQSLLAHLQKIFCRVLSSENFLRYKQLLKITDVSQSYQYHGIICQKILNTVPCGAVARVY